MKNVVTIENGRIEYLFHKVKRPEAPVIVMLHEGLGTLSLWRDFPKKLSSLLNCSVLVYSRHGYGYSDFINEEFDTQYMHREALSILPQLLSHFEITDPILYGHSDGASIALIHASAADTRVKGLILEAPHVFVENISLDGLKAARDAFEKGELKASLAKHHCEPEKIFRYWNNIWLSPSFLGWNIVSCVSDIRCPTLLIQGEQDAYGTLSQVDTIMRNISSNCEKKILPAIGHSPHRETSELVLQSVQSFINRNINAPNSIIER
ncbi:MAG: alpha/beta hydrolase [Alphaproteobacteria bacterium]|nr:alpha/beta hydrolase [Alphaproteobacteria bacterium]